MRCTFLSITGLALAAANSDVYRLLQGSSNLSSSAKCVDGQAVRACAVSESMHGGVTHSRSTNKAKDPYPCPCPTYGDVKEFTVSIVQDQIPNKLLPGKTRTVVRFNSQDYGPVLEVNENDWVIVHVTNSNVATNGGTTAHWHGFVQHGTQYADGVPGMTQCLIQPGQSLTYQFRASLSGTFFYHGHHRANYINGLVAPLIVHRKFPAGSAIQSEEQLWGYASDSTFMIQDFYNNEAGFMFNNYYLTPGSGGTEPIPDAITINGDLTDTHSITVDRTQKSRLRFICGSSLSMFSISTDYATMSIIEIDGTSTKATPVSSFTINSAQRASVLVEWSAVPAGQASVKIHVTALASMYAVDIKNYIPPYEQRSDGVKPLNPHYTMTVNFKAAATPASVPAAQAAAAPPAPTQAPPQSDNNQMSATPFDIVVAPDPTHYMYLEVVFGAAPGNFIGTPAALAGVNVATVNGIFGNFSNFPDLFKFVPPLSASLPPASSYNLGPPTTGVDATGFDHSGLVSIMHNSKGQYNVPYNAVVEMIIYNTDAGEHPLHKHTGPFWVISTSEWPGAATANTSNYPRRDVVSIPAGGWARIRYVADVPGIWAVHCHIAWHAENGFLAQIIDGADQIQTSMPSIPADFSGVCKTNGIKPTSA